MISTKLCDNEFFFNCLDTSVPELNPVSNLVSVGRISEAKKIFANYIRAFFSSEKSESDDNLGPDFVSKLKSEADRVKNHTLISCRVPYTFGEKIDWEFNPTYNNFKEWTWILNRHFEWNFLANYYKISRDESYAEEWVLQYLSWIDQALCPDEILNTSDGCLKETKCWRTLEAAIRMSTWYFCIKTFANAKSLSDEFITVFFKSICEHGRYLMKSKSERNFILHEMSALALIGFRYTFLKESSAWLNYANDRMKKEIDIQVYPDGMHYEMTTHYHQGCLQEYLGIYNMYVESGKKPPEYTVRAMELMYGAYVKMARPDLYCPTMNDGDGVNACEVMKTAVEIFPDRSDFKYFASNRSEGNPPDYGSCFMEYSGIVAMRTGWDKNAVWAYMDGSPLGYGHHHDDRNNIQVYAYGHELLIEAGNFDYDSSEMRKYVVSSRGHNCSRIDGLDQNMRKHYKRVSNVTSVKSDTLWRSTSERDVAESLYTAGYGEDPMTYVDWRRKLIFLKNESGIPPIFVVVDRFAAHDNRMHDYELIWHMKDNPTCMIKNTVYNTYSDGVGVSVSSSDGTMSVVRGIRIPVYQGWFPKFGVGDVEHFPIPTVLNCGRFSGSRRIVTVLEPFENNNHRVLSVQAENLYDCRELTIILRDGRKIAVTE